MSYIYRRNNKTEIIVITKSQYRCIYVTGYQYCHMDLLVVINKITDSEKVSEFL